MKTATQSVIDRLWEASIPVSFGGIVPDRYVWLDDAVCVVRDAVDALVERAEKAEAALDDLKLHHAEVVHDLRGKLEVAEAKVERLRHPALDAPPPTEPGRYWAEDAEGVEIVLVADFSTKDNEVRLAVMVAGTERIYPLSAWSRWSARLPEPEEVKP